MLGSAGTRGSGGAYDASESHLQVSVEPAQSSFFAGEEFACTITFTNTRDPVPYSAPLPSRATFDSPGTPSTPARDDLQRRVASSSAAFQGRSLVDLLGHSRHGSTHDRGEGSSNGHAGPSLPLRSGIDASKYQGLHSPMSSLSLSPSLGRLASSRHRKSQSVDIRTYAQRHQLERSNLVEDDNASDERYYRNLSEAADREEMRMASTAEGSDGEYDADNEEYMAMLHAQELLQNLPARRNLIGKADPPPTNDQATSSERGAILQYEAPAVKGHTKAHSVAAAGYNLGAQQAAQTPQKHQQQLLGLGRPLSNTPNGLASPRVPSQRFQVEVTAPSPQSSRGTSGTIRKASETISKSHPHSRKRSVAQVQAEDLSSTFELDGESSSRAALFGQSSEDSDPLTPSSSLTPRSSLDARTRQSENGFYGVGDNTTMDSILQEDMAELSRTQRKSNKREQGTSSLPGSETVLWAFAHLNGHFMLDESLVKPGEFEQVKQKLVASRGPSSPFIGGGELGDVAEHDDRDGTSSRKTSWGWGSSLSALLLGGNNAGNGSHARSSHLHRRSGSTLGDTQNRTMGSRQVPIFSNPPSIIAVDLDLAPGQSKSYTYRIPLPPDIPPSYVGRAISFTYALTLGTNRLVKGRRGLMEQKSRLAKIPMRVYNHVNMSGATAFFDLTNPIVNYKDTSSLVEIEDADGRGLSFNPPVPPVVATKNKKGATKRVTSEADDALSAYTKGLLATCGPATTVFDDLDEDMPNDIRLAAQLARTRLSDSNATKTSPTSLHKILPHAHVDDYPQAPRMLPTTSQRRRRGQDITQAGLGLHMDDDDLPTSSLQAVEVLSRNSQKVSYDIAKDGEVAAVLTLIKSKYRLGDTILGVVSINHLKCVARVVRFAATLETHEEIEGSLSTLPAARAQKLTRVVRGKCDDATLDTGQACFSLPIPSGATPNFHTSAVRFVWTLRLAFLTLSSVRNAKDETRRGQQPLRPPAHLAAGTDDGYGAYHSVLRAVPALAGPWTDDGKAGGEPSTEEAKLEIVECVVPLTVLPHSTRFAVGEVAYAA